MTGDTNDKILCVKFDDAWDNVIDQKWVYSGSCEETHQNFVEPDSGDCGTCPPNYHTPDSREECMRAADSLGAVWEPHAGLQIWSHETDSDARCFINQWDNFNLVFNENGRACSETSNNDDFGTGCSDEGYQGIVCVPIPTSPEDGNAPKWVQSGRWVYSTDGTESATQSRLACIECSMPLYLSLHQVRRELRPPVPGPLRHRPNR